MGDGPNAITKLYDLLKWLMPLVSKFPRNKRYTLGTRIENRLMDILELLIEAHYSKEKIHLLKKANIHLEVLRYLVRLSHDMHFINIQRYAYAGRSLNDAGKFIGAWIKQQAAK